MQSVKVRRSGISAEQAAEAIRDGLGDGYQVQATGDAMVGIRKGLARARVNLRGEPGGTVFDVRGEGIWPVLPFSLLVTKMLNERGIARRTAAVISEAEAFRDDS